MFFVGSAANKASKELDTLISLNTISRLFKMSDIFSLTSVCLLWGGYVLTPIFSKQEPSASTTALFFIFDFVGGYFLTFSEQKRIHLKTCGASVAALFLSSHTENKLNK